MGLVTDRLRGLSPGEKRLYRNALVGSTFFAGVVYLVGPDAGLVAGFGLMFAALIEIRRAVE